jgi:DNA repair exonuclease SbcCD ATPase subunit
LRIKENELQIKNDAIQLLDKVGCEIRIQELQIQVANLSKPDESVYKSYLARQLDINKQLAVVDKELSDIINKQQYLNYTMNNGNYYCDSCGQLVTIEHLQKEYSKLEDLFSVKTLEFHNIKNRLDTIDGSIRTELSKIEREKALFLDNSVKLNAEIQEQLNAISDIDKNNKLKNSIQDDIIFIQNRIKEESNKINPWISIQQEDNLKLTRCNNDLLQINQQLDSIITLKECYAFWIKALGPKGLKSYILDTKLSELNASINYWVKLLTDGTIWVELGSYKKGRGKKIINSPEVNICRWAPDGSIISRNYRSWSGGEKQRISIAIDLGLSSIISRRSTKQYNLLILDEIFRHLDSDGKHAVMDMLQLLAKDKDSVFVIDHDPDFQSLFENRITVIKENGQSNLVEDTFNEDKRYTEETNSLISSRAYFKRRAIRNTI